MTISIELDKAEDLLEGPTEEFILGTVLLSTTSRHLVPDLLERVAAEDFYDTHIGRMWSSAKAIIARGDTVSRRTLLAEGATEGMQARIRAMSGEPVEVGRLRAAATNVTELAKSRRLVQALKRIAENTPNAATYSEALQFAAEQIAGLAEAQPSRDARSFADVLESWHEWLAAPKSAIRVMPTPWVELNEMLADGLHPGRSYIVGGRPGEGKALSLDTRLPTPTGWTTMGDIQVGDFVLDAEGRPTRVVNATEVMHNHEVFRVEFNDGSSILADADHLWETSTRAVRRAGHRATPPLRNSKYSRDQRHLSEKPSVKTTQAIRDTLRVGSDARINHCVELTDPLDLPRVELPIDPYVLGVWLGDGTSGCAQITSEDDQIPALVAERGYRIRRLSSPMRYTLAGDGTFLASLRGLRVLRNKHIPMQYLRASLPQRLDLLRGLMDTDGSIDKQGRCEIGLTSEALSAGVRELVSSLGIRSTVFSKKVKGRTAETSICRTIKFTTDIQVFALPRKASRIPSSVRGTQNRRYITDVVPVESVPVRCIQVDNERHLYLAGETMIPTHNSIALLNLAVHAAEHGHPGVIFSVEMGDIEVASRIMAAGAHAEYRQITKRQIDQHNRMKIAEYEDTYGSMPLTLVDKSDVTVDYIAAQCRTLKRREIGLDVIVVDYLQLLRESDSRQSRERQVAHISRSLKILARELDCAVIIACQLNRNAAGPDKKPALIDLRESGAIEQDCDVAILLHHELINNQPTGEVSLCVAKNRTGRIGAVTLPWRAYQARIG